MDANSLVSDFIRVAQLAGIHISDDMIYVDAQAAPHTPPTSIPVGKLAIYIFYWGEKCLKVGIVGAKSKSRFTSQHYNPMSSKSNLAKSILTNRERLGLPDINEANVRDWIITNTDRINIFIDASLGVYSRNLLESFLHCRLNPLFEGFESQRRL